MTKILNALFLRFWAWTDRLSARLGPGVFLCIPILTFTLLLVNAPFYCKIIVGGVGILFTASTLYFRIPASDRCRFAVLMFCIGIALSGFSASVFDTAVYHPAQKAENARAYLKAVVLDYGTSYDDRVRVRLLVTDTGGLMKRSFYSYVYLDGMPDVSPGDTLSGWCRFYQPRSYDSFDLKPWYRSQRVYLLTEFSEDYTLIHGEKLSWYIHLRYLFPARCSHWVKERLAAVTEPEIRVVLTALILGDTSELNDSYLESMRKTGLSHVTAVSGMNVSLIAGFFLLVLRRRAGSAAAIPTVLLFMLMTGAEASVTRAAIMQIILLVSYLLHEEANVLNTLCITLSLMLLCNPYAIQDVGLILSFSASLGLILFGGKLQYSLTKPFRSFPYPVRKTLAIPAGLISTTLCAQLFTLPFTLFIFGSFSLIAPFANILVVWASELAFLLGVLCIFVPIRFPGILLGKLAALPVRYQLTLVPFLAKLPVPTLYSDNPYALLNVICLYLLLAVWFIGRKKEWGQSQQFRAGLTCTAILLTCCISLFSIWENLSHLTVGILDTGGGSCTVLSSGNDCIVINCGGMKERSASLLKEYLDRRGQYDIDLLILTDYNSGEISGVSSLGNLISVQTVLTPLTADGTISAWEGLGQTVNADLLESVDIGKLHFRLLPSHAEGFDCNRMAVYMESSAATLLYPGSIAPGNLAALLEEAGIDSADIISASSYYAAHELPIKGKIYLIPSYMGIENEQKQRILESSGSVVDLRESGSAELRFKQ